MVQQKAATKINPVHYREFIKRVKYNVPFGFLNGKGEFRAFVNIDIDDDGNYVYVEHGNTHSIAQRIVKEKKIPADEWFQNIVFVNEQGKATALSKVSLTIAKKKEVEKKSEEKEE
jgi:hypothetical protein